MNTHVQGLSSASGVRLEQIVGSRGNATCKPLWKCRTGLNCSQKHERRASPCVEAPAGFLCCHRRAPPGPPTRHRLISPRWPMAQPRPSFCPDTGVSFLPPPLPAAAGSAWDPSPHFQGGFLVLCVKESPKHNTEPHPVPSRPLPQSRSPPLLPRKGPPSAFPGRCSRTWSHLQGETHAPRRGLHARSRHTFLVFFPLCRCCSNLLQLVPVTFAVREEK